MFVRSSSRWQGTLEKVSSYTNWVFRLASLLKAIGVDNDDCEIAVAASVVFSKLLLHHHSSQCNCRALAFSIWWNIVYYKRREEVPLLRTLLIPSWHYLTHLQLADHSVADTINSGSKVLCYVHWQFLSMDCSVSKQEEVWSSQSSSDLPSDGGPSSKSKKSSIIFWWTGNTLAMSLKATLLYMT